MRVGVRGGGDGMMIEEVRWEEGSSGCWKLIGVVAKDDLSPIDEDHVRVRLMGKLSRRIG